MLFLIKAGLVNTVSYPQLLTGKVKFLDVIQIEFLEYTLMDFVQVSSSIVVVYFH